MNYAYILRCADDSFYTGWTNNLSHRLEANNNGTGGKDTRARRPVELVYSEEFAAYLPRSTQQQVFLNVDGLSPVILTAQIQYRRFRI